MILIILNILIVVNNYSPKMAAAKTKMRVQVERSFIFLFCEKNRHDMILQGIARINND
jgi:hypothetical protein